MNDTIEIILTIAVVWVSLSVGFILMVSAFSDKDK